MDKLEIEQLTVLNDAGLLVRVIEDGDVQNALVELLEYKTLEESEQLIKLEASYFQLMKRQKIA